MKKTIYQEWAYILGLIILAIGTALMEKTDFGVSMVVAPAYILHLKISEFLPFFSFGMAEYTLQAVLIVLMVILLRRFRISYLFSFVTAVIYGLLLDASIWLVSFIPMESIVSKTIFYALGLVTDSLAISLLFHSYISPEAYELFVMEVAHFKKWEIHKVKTIYDCVSCLAAILLSFLFFGFGHFEGVKWGTIVCAIVNGWIISRFSLLWSKYFTFHEAFPSFKKFFRQKQ